MSLLKFMTQTLRMILGMQHLICVDNVSNANVLLHDRNLLKSLFHVVRGTFLIRDNKSD